MVNDADEQELRLRARIRRYTDETLANFDPERVAAVAVTQRHTVVGPAVTTAGAVIVVLLAGLAISLFDGRGALSPVTASQVPSSATATGTPEASALGLTKDQAVLVARAATPRSADWSVLSAKAGRVDELLVPEAAFPISPFPSRDRWVWVIDLGAGPAVGGQGSIVVLDYIDGHVYAVLNWIS